MLVNAAYNYLSPFLRTYIKKSKEYTAVLLNDKLVTVWILVQRFNPDIVYSRKLVSAFLIYETMIHIGNTNACLWIAIGPLSNDITGVYFSIHKNVW
jgi:hypothetical protein